MARVNLNAYPTKEEEEEINFLVSKGALSGVVGDRIFWSIDANLDGLCCGDFLKGLRENCRKGGEYKSLNYSFRMQPLGGSYTTRDVCVALSSPNCFFVNSEEKEKQLFENARESWRKEIGAKIVEFE